MMKKNSIILLIGILFSLIIVSGVEAGIPCNTTQDCYNYYQDSSYTCEFIQEEMKEGYFCQQTKDCGLWQFTRCEEDFAILKNDCGDEKKKQCLGCREVQVEKREICEVIDEVTGERGNCRIVGGGLSYECSGEPPDIALGEECQVDNDCAPLEYCPDRSSYRISKCVNGKCEEIDFAGGNPCFDEGRGCTPGLDCPENNTTFYLLFGLVIVVFLIILWWKFVKQK